MKKRIILFFVFLGVFSAAFSLGAEMQVPEEEAKIFLEEFNKLLESLKGENFGFEIFLHNTQIALTMFIPGFGIGWGVFSAVSTGFAFAALATTTPLLGQIPLVQSIRESGDAGRPSAANTDSILSVAFNELAQRVIESVEHRNNTMEPTKIVEIIHQ